MKTKRILGIALAVCMTMGLTTVPAMAEDKKTFVFGDTTFNAENQSTEHLRRLGLHPLWCRRNPVPLF